MPPIIGVSKKDAFSLYGGAYRENFFRTRLTDEEVILDVYVQSLDHLYLDPVTTDFGTVQQGIDPEFLYRLANIPILIKRPYRSALKKKNLKIVFHVAEKYLRDGTADTLEQDIHAELKDLLPRMEMVKKDQKSNHVTYLLVGSIIIILSTILDEIFDNIIDYPGFLLGVIEGVYVLAWVILWRPIDYYVLYMVQGRHMKQVYRKIVQADVTTVAWDGVAEDS